eukprot:5584316-Amphidinium_carterae.1
MSNSEEIAVGTVVVMLLKVTSVPAEDVEALPAGEGRTALCTEFRRVAGGALRPRVDPGHALQLHILRLRVRKRGCAQRRGELGLAIHFDNIRDHSYRQSRRECHTTRRTGVDHLSLGLPSHLKYKEQYKEQYRGQKRCDLALLFNKNQDRPRPKSKPPIYQQKCLF